LGFSPRPPTGRPAQPGPVWLSARPGPSRPERRPLPMAAPGGGPATAAAAALAALLAAAFGGGGDSWGSGGGLWEGLLTAGSVEGVGTGGLGGGTGASSAAAASAPTAPPPPLKAQAAAELAARLLLVGVLAWRLLWLVRRRLSGARLPRHQSWQASEKEEEKENCGEARLAAAAVAVVFPDTPAPTSPTPCDAPCCAGDEDSHAADAAARRSREVAAEIEAAAQEAADLEERLERQLVALMFSQEVAPSGDAAAAGQAAVATRSLSRGAGGGRGSVAAIAPRGVEAWHQRHQTPAAANFGVVGAGGAAAGIGACAAGGSPLRKLPVSGCAAEAGHHAGSGANSPTVAAVADGHHVATAATDAALAADLVQPPNPATHPSRKRCCSTTPTKFVIKDASIPPRGVDEWLVRRHALSPGSGVGAGAGGGAAAAGSPMVQCRRSPASSKAVAATGTTPSKDATAAVAAAAAVKASNPRLSHSTSTAETWASCSKGSWCNMRRYGVNHSPPNNNCGRWRQMDSAGPGVYPFPL